MRDTTTTTKGAETMAIIENAERFEKAAYGRGSIIACVSGNGPHHHLGVMVMHLSGNLWSENEARKYVCWMINFQDVDRGYRGTFSGHYTDDRAEALEKLRERHGHIHHELTIDLLR